MPIDEEKRYPDGKRKERKKRNPTSRPASYTPDSYYHGPAQMHPYPAASPYAMGYPPYSPYYPPPHITAPGYFAPGSLHLQDQAPPNYHPGSEHSRPHSRSRAGSKTSSKARKQSFQYEEPAGASQAQPEAPRKKKQSRRASEAIDPRILDIREGQRASDAPTSRPRSASDAPKKTHHTKFLDAADERRSRRVSDFSVEYGDHPLLQPPSPRNLVSATDPIPSQTAVFMSSAQRAPPLKSALKESSRHGHSISVQPDFDRMTISAPKSEPPPHLTQQARGKSVLTPTSSRPASPNDGRADQINDALYGEIQAMMDSLRAVPSNVGLGRKVEIELNTGSEDSVLHVVMQMGFRNVHGEVASVDDLYDEDFYARS